MRACTYLYLGGVGSDGWGIYCIHKWLSEFPIFSSVVKEVHSNRPAAYLPARHRHATMAATKSPQCEAQ